MANTAAQLAAYKAMYQPIAVNAAINNGLDPTIFSALIESESSWDPFAVPKDGSSTAKGLGQLLKGTARDFGVTDAFDPVQNLNGSAAKLAQTLKMYGNYPSAIASYKGIANPSGLGATHDYVSKVYEIAGITPQYSENTTGLMGAGKSNTSSGSVSDMTLGTDAMGNSTGPTTVDTTTPISGDKSIFLWGLDDWKNFFTKTATGIVLFLSGLALIIFAIYAIVTRTKAVPVAVSKLAKG